MSYISLPPILDYIGRSAFYKCGTNELAKDKDTGSDVLVIPSSVTYIGDFAFYSCVYTEKASISEEEYYNHYGIDSVVIGGNVEYIGANAFWGCASLVKLELGGTASIGDKAFYKCEQLAEIDFGTRLTHIGDKAFYNCVSLADVSLPETLSEIGNYAFYKCEALKTLTLGSAERIGKYAFFGNYSLERVILPTSLEFIGRQAFRNCHALTAVILSAEIGEIEQHAFYGSKNLTFYLEGEATPDTWHKRWNSSYRPIVAGCVLSEDKTYVIYTVKSDIENLNSTNSVSDPVREGYSFVGWGTSATSTSPSHTSSDISDAENGKKLYAIWAEAE